MLSVDNMQVAKKFYGGAACLKICVIEDNKKWMVKLPFGYDAPIWEHVGSQIFDVFNLSPHETRVGEFVDQTVVLCKDFVKDGVEFYNFENIKNSFICMDEPDSVIARCGNLSNIDIILNILETHPLLRDAKNRMTRFWGMFLVDFLIGNQFRTNTDWGFLFSDLGVSCAPIFDNCSCLGQDVPEEDISVYLADEEKLTERALSGVSSYFTDKVGRNIWPISLIASNTYVICTYMLKVLFRDCNIRIPLCSLIDNAEGLTNSQKAFSKAILGRRCNKLRELAHSLNLNHNEFFAAYKSATDKDFEQSIAYQTALKAYCGDVEEALFAASSYSSFEL